MPLSPLEFTDCLLDSPHFREKLHEHEKELDRTSKAIKTLTSQCKALIEAAKNLSKAQTVFSQNLQSFKFECVGSGQTDDEVEIETSLKEIGNLIQLIENARATVLDSVNQTIIEPLENFRRVEIGGAKDEKKRFDAQTKKFCNSLERYLSVKARSSDAQLDEATAQVLEDRKAFNKTSAEYVLKLQTTQQKKVVDLPRTLLQFMYGWLTFYHEGYEIFQEYKPYTSSLQAKIAKIEESFISTRTEADDYMNRLLEKPQEHLAKINSADKHHGYLFVMRKQKALGTTWVKYYCEYFKQSKQLHMIQFSQVGGGKILNNSDVYTLQHCVRRANDAIDRRFCFDVSLQDVHGKPIQYTLQGLSDDDRRQWLNIMDGKEPELPVMPGQDDLSHPLDEQGAKFVLKCIQAIEARALREPGIYRIVGVTSRYNALVQQGLDPAICDQLDLLEPLEFDIKTMTSALKSYLRHLPEPLLTFALHSDFIAAAKLESPEKRVSRVHALTHKLPEANFEMLKMVMNHLYRVACQKEHNRMSVANIGVCFGPTLMRPKEETMAAIMDIKFCNVVVEILIERSQEIFTSAPADAPIEDIRSNSVLNKPSAVNHTPQPFRVPAAAPTPDPTDGDVSSDDTNLVAKSPPEPVRRLNANSMRQNYFEPESKPPWRGPAFERKRLPEFTEQETNHWSPGPQQATAGPAPTRGRARTLYPCEAENDSELSFEAQQIIVNVRESHEPGWFEGTLNGKTGLIPANYVELLT